ncbi:type II secretion system major pseudopilin GspG [Halomonas sp. SSL-5]|uniref:type II secretion system major pseudopilin GspG n=1 Tax=Halomonas sp. SSL-5 TaxID=3065855 RepID=UPI00273A3F1F|nr:type II secretion system major pseudopilin GspG [Halomonas sp. SSL-5]MDY7117019.1 type II secretion system major pseudopilin GspG [Halomonas sp. SSL-5]
MRHPAYRPSPQSGFTLLEIMVVIFILGLLVAIVAPNVLSNQDDAMRQKARADIATLEQALDMYRLDNLRYPTSDQGLKALATRPSQTPQPDNYRQGGYVRRLPVDPWGNAYQYRHPGEHADIDIYTLGADARPGGEGQDADIGNWML